MSGMRDIDREVLERLEKDGNVLGWKPRSRDAEGNAVLHCTHPGSVNVKTGERSLRVTYMKITEEGLFYDEVVHGGVSFSDG
jgi:hypothetical protein